MICTAPYLQPGPDIWAVRTKSRSVSGTRAIRLRFRSATEPIRSETRLWTKMRPRSYSKRNHPQWNTGGSEQITQPDHYQPVITRAVFRYQTRRWPRTYAHPPLIVVSAAPA